MESEDRKIDLIKYRLELAEEKLKSSAILLNNGQYKDSVGRSYYAIYSALRAIMAKDGIDHRKHAGVISDYQKNYIKTGIFEKKFSDFVNEAFQVRNACDYDDFYIVAKTDAEQQHSNASELLKATKEYLNNYINEITKITKAEEMNAVSEDIGVYRCKGKGRKIQ